MPVQDLLTRYNKMALVVYLFVLTSSWYKKDTVTVGPHTVQKGGVQINTDWNTCEQRGSLGSLAVQIIRSSRRASRNGFLEHPILSKAWPTSYKRKKKMGKKSEYSKPPRASPIRSTRR
jgi:hypothetical protein